MKRAWYLVIVATLALSLPVGCKKDTDGDKKSDKKAGSDESGGSNGPSAEEMADRMLAQKLQPYIKMTNYLSKFVFDGRRRYFHWVKDLKGGPTCKEKDIVYGVFTVPSPERFAKAVDKVQKKDPDLKELQDGATQYIDAVRKLEPLLKKANRYYKQKDYKEDECKGAQAMHPKMMALWKQFTAADRVVGRQIEKLNLALQYRLLARIAKKEGKTSPRYYHKKFTLDARTVLILLSRSSKQKEPDHDKIAAAVKKIDALYTEMADKTKGKQPSGFSSFESSTDKFVGAAKEMMRRLKSGKKFTKHERRRFGTSTASWVKGSYPKLLKAFNDMIGSANRVRFSR